MPDVTGMRLDAALPLLFPGLTRSRGEKLILEGKALVNGQTEKPNYRVKAQDNITCEPASKAPIPLVGEPIPLSIVYEDEDLILLNKPKGLVVHPAPGHTKGTLVNALLGYTQALSSLGGADRPGIVHRLDKDTSGLLIVAKNNAIHEKLAEQIQAREMDRQYLCIAKGCMKGQPFTVNTPIGRHPKNRKQMAVLPTGRPAKTDFTPVAFSENYTLIDCKLVTGRTHQIRVHLASIGHSILGDPVYGRNGKIKAASQALYAYRLSFLHPKSGRRITAQVPPPEEFILLCGKAGLKIPNSYQKGGITFGTNTEIS